MKPTQKATSSTTKKFIFTKDELHNLLVMNLKEYLEYVHLYNESDAVALSDAADSLIYELEIGEIIEKLQQEATT